MKNKHIISTILVMTIFFGLSASFAAGTPGSQTDPLISKSYVDNTYPSTVFSVPLDNLKNSVAVLKYKLNQMGSSATPGFYTINANPGGTLAFSTGNGFTLQAGAATLSACTGTVIDLSTGAIVYAGSTLSAGHRYLAAENTKAEASFTTASRVSVFGNAKAGQGGAPKFRDVTADKWYYNDVNYAAEKGLIEGRESGIYAPEASLSIAEAIKLAACMHQLYHNGSVSLVGDPQTWYMSYVSYAVENGIISKTYSNYNAVISRREFVSIFYSALPATEYAQKNSVADNSIPDVKMTTASAAQIYTFYRAGILVGSDNAYFLPENNIRRSEVAAVLTRMFDKNARQSITLS